MSYPLDGHQHLILRKSNRVRRSHSEIVLKEETVGHHCANVGCIILDLYSPAYPRCELLAWALYHDAGEQFTGDMPAPAKWADEKLRDALRTVDYKWKEERGFNTTLTPQERAIAAFADIYDLTLFAQEEVEMGNQFCWDMRDRGYEATMDRMGTLDPPYYGRARTWMNVFERRMTRR